MPRLPILLSLLVACAPEPEPGTDFSLRLAPLLAEGQDPFAGATLDLLVTDALGTAVYELGDASDGPWEQVDVGPLDAAEVALRLRPAGVTEPTPAQVAGWGRTAPVTASEGTVEVPVLVAATGQVGAFGRLDATTHQPAAAVLASGDVVLFGGSPTGVLDPNDPASLDLRAFDGIWRLSRLDENAAFEPVGSLPSVDNDPPQRVAGTATAITVDGEERVLLVGGRSAWGKTVSGTARSVLWDPITRTQTAGPSLPTGGRSQHVAVKVQEDVLILGGFVDNQPNVGGVVIDTWRATAKDWVRAGELANTGGVGFGWARLDDGVLVCGGGRTDTGGGRRSLAATRGCHVVPRDGAARRVADLGFPVQDMILQGHAMAALPDGTVLLTGGTDTSVSDATASAAVARAWRYDPVADAWSPLPDMGTPRAHHAMVPLPDGRVLVVGGAQAIGGVPPFAMGDAVGCAEVFDPASATFAPVAPCTEAGAGAWPVVAEGPDVDFVLQGMGPSGGGLNWGLIPRPPTP
ncbi:MAG: hypothetical protein H6732_00920 [Alphaproteobacteria bacterium]|nr:hypothetical protein [Alphaproteobacteria bacterium]